MNKELIELIEAGDWDSALSKLKEYLAQDATPADKGRIYAIVAEKYMDAVTELNEKESALIGEAIEMMQNLEKKEIRVDEESGLAQARSVLK